MADVKFEVVRFALSTASAGNTQDVTISGFGTPKAAIFIHTFASVDDTIAAASRFGIGFSDGTNNVSVDVDGADGVVTTNTERGHTNAAAIQFTNAGAAVHAFSVNSFITDGVRLDIDLAAGAGYLVTCILVGGSDVASAHVGSKDDLGTSTSPVDINTVGFEPDLVFIIGCGLNSALPAYGAENILSFGCGHNDGSDTQRLSVISSRSSQDTSITNAYISNANISSQIFSDSVSWLASIGSYDSSGFSLTPASSAGSDIVSYLCLKFTNSPDISLFDMQWPTSGNYAETGPGFEPGFGLISSVVGPTSRNTIATSNCFGFSISTFDDSNIYTDSVTDKDNVGASVSKSLSSDQLRILDDDGSTNAVVASSYAFDSDGWDFTLSTNPGSAVLGWGLAIGGGGAQSITVNGITQAQSIGGVTLTQAHDLSVNDIEQGQLLGTTALVQANVLAVAGVDQAQTLDNVTLTQAHIIAVNDIDQSQTIDGVTLTQAGSIAPAGITQAQLIDAVTLTQANILSVNDIEQAQGIDGVTLTVAGSLAIQSVLQGQTIGATALTQAHTLSVDGLTQAQAIEAASLAQHYQLAIQSLIQGQTLGNVTLSAAGLGLAIDGIAQGQTIEAAGLTEHAVLSVNDLTQSQIIDIVNLGGLVIGSLNGTLVMYAKLGGNVVSYTLLDGTVQTVH